MATKKKDPLTRPKLALAGRVVTMDDRFTVLRRGVIYMEAGRIVAVVDAAGSPPGTAPPGFEDVKPVDVGGTIFPGLIELHNHLSYNALRLWDVPKKYSNRDQWSGTPDYRALISGPMLVLGQSPGLLPALGALCRVQVPARRRHHEPGHRALQQRRGAPLLQGGPAHRGADAGPGPPRGRDEDRRCRGRRYQRVLHATAASVVLPPAPERGDQRRGPGPLPGAQDPRWRLGDHQGPGRDPLCGPEARGLRGDGRAWRRGRSGRP